MGTPKRETKQASQWGALELRSDSWQGAQPPAKQSNLLQTWEGKGHQNQQNYTSAKYFFCFSTAKQSLSLQ